MVDSAPHGVRRRVKWVMGVATLLIRVAFLALWVMAGSVASPDRWKLQDYHRSYLDDPEEHGLLIRQESFMDGRIADGTVRENDS